MHKQEHGPYDVQLINKGANRDVNKELLQLSPGEYIDAQNMRVDSTQGDSSAAEKIFGEEILYPNIDNRCIDGTGLPLSTSYECIGNITIKNHIVEFWADSNQELPSFIRIEGKIVLMSSDFPITTLHPLQLEKNESCIGGEVYLTDFFNQPMLFNIEDLMSNSGMTTDSVCTQKYFTEFVLAQYQLILSAPVDHPVFIKETSSTSGIDKVFGTGGLPVGMYSYQIRFSTSDGEKTGWSVPTPIIPVTQRYTGSCAPVYPYSGTHGKDPNIASPSPFGLHVRFRVYNKNNYDFIEVRRNRWNTGDILTAPPVSEVIGFVDIANGEVSIYDVLDNGVQFESVLSLDEAIETLSAVDRAKGIRYYNGRLYLANIEYASRNIEGSVDLIGEDDGTALFPTIEKMGKAGHKEPYHYAYHRSYPAGEQHGHGIVVYDDNFNPSYARPITGFESYQMPNRRDPISAFTRGTSYYGAVTAADTNGDIGLTHEVFDTLDCTVKTDLCRFANVLDVDDSAAGKNTSLLENFASDLGESCPISGTGLNTNSHEVGYYPFTPVSQDDTDCSGTQMRINPYVANSGGQIENNPKGFGLDYFSLGMAARGIENIPSWASAFSFVRTKPAQRVVAQGLGFYKMNSAGVLETNTTKEKNKILFYAPDLDSSIGLNPGAIDTISASLSNYAVQCVSPLGFFTEVYSFKNTAIGSDEGVDFISYARVLKDLYGTSASGGVMNPNEHSGAGITDGPLYYTGFGKWRNNSFNSNYPFGGSGNTLFDIVSITPAHRGRSNFWEITLASDLYDTGTTGGPTNGNDPAVQDWHEPIYVLNIVQKNVSVPDTNITEYVKTGHYQKVSSLIGVSDGTNNQEMILVDERWEDCMAVTSGMSPGFNDYSSLYRFIYVEDTALNRRRWVNIYNRTPSEVSSILTQLNTSGVATVTDTSGAYSVYGVYSQSEFTDGACPVYSVVFNHFDTSYPIGFFVPTTGYNIYVDYDNRIPIRYWGGDANVGEATAAFMDNKYNENADPDTGDDDFRLNIAFPYREYELNPRIYIIKKTKLLMAPFDNFIQDEETFKFDNGLGTAPAKIRQLVAMFTCEARVNLSYAFNDEATKHSSNQYFPLKNYVIRPYRWDSSKFGDGAAAVYSDNNIFSNYEDSYGNEFEQWGYGGLRFLPQVNIDYSKIDNSGQPIFSIPDVGFTEENHFCTRIIWSALRPINAQNSPGVRTFPGANFYDISDDTGEIKFLWDALSGAKGNNLYAFTESGICMPLVDKRVVSEINGNELATVGSDIGGIQSQYWISKSIGMNDEMWRSAAEFQNMIFWCNSKSAFMLSDNGLADIGRKGYFSKIYYDYLKYFPSGFSGKVTAVYDQLHNEYWVNFKEGVQPDIEYRLTGPFSITDTMGGPNDNIVLVPTSNVGYTVYLGGVSNNQLGHPVTICVDSVGLGAQANVSYYDENGNLVSVAILNEGECAYFVPLMDGAKPTWYISRRYSSPTLVYSMPNEHWLGGFDYDFDQYTTIDNQVYGVRSVETFELNKGFYINGEPINGVVWSPSSKNLFDDKEFVRFRVNSNRKPTRMEFFLTMNQAISSNVQAFIDGTLPNAIRDYDGFEQFIPRKTEEPRDRMQGRLLISKIIHNFAEPFIVSSVGIQTKNLK